MNKLETSSGSTPEPEDAPRVKLPRVARLKLAIVFASVTALIAAAGFAAGLLVPRSPAAEGLALTEPAPVNAPVELRVVEETTVAQGSVAPGRKTDVMYVPAEDPGVIPFVTATGVSVGTPVSSGSLVLAVAGRPMIALRVDSPLYRPLRVGDTGSDVLAFERALSALVPGDYDVDEFFSANSMSAAEELWETRGYALPTEEVAASSLPPTSTASPAPSQNTAPIRYSYVPVTEIVQLMGNDVTVDSIAAVGDLAGAEEPLAQLSAASKEIQLNVSVVDEGDFIAGTAVVLSAPGVQDAAGTVLSIGELVIPDSSSDTSGAPAGREATVALPDGWNALPEGTVVQMSPEGSSSPVLAIPLTAIRDASGSPHVIVDTATSFEAGERVDIGVLSTGSGWAQISEVGLEPGDSVRITP